MFLWDHRQQCLRTEGFERFMEGIESNSKDLLGLEDKFGPVSKALGPELSFDELVHLHERSFNKSSLRQKLWRILFGAVESINQKRYREDDIRMAARPYRASRRPSKMEIAAGEYLVRLTLIREFDSISSRAIAHLGEETQTDSAT
jgi:hypothetical protein